MKATIAIELRIGAKRLHHRLVEGLGVIGSLQDDIAVGQNGVHIPVAVHIACHQVAAVVAAHLTGREPVFLRMD